MRHYERYIRYRTFPTPWCPGCGDGVVLKSIAMAFSELELDPNDIVVVAGIGCSGRMPTFFNTNTLHTTHGRALTFATGIKLARPDKMVVVISGDGDATAIGGNHLIHAARRNIGINLVLINNGVYGMTGGQVSPLTPQKFITETTPYGNIEPKFDIAELLIAAKASFVARETVNRPVQLKDVVKKSFQHKGFSVVEVISNCHINLGRRNRMKDPIAMTKWIEGRTVSKAQYEKMSPEERLHMYPTGILFEDKDRLEYSDLYYKHIIPAAQAAAEAAALKQAERTSASRKVKS
ncbi:MAG: 2-oxoglutarate ferredoxin oxidoreductase subunit beta [Candidatus Aminicenantes bacterium]|nr:2-oxoglutarate ferredoxin oxidoreductase subunit beta [Candidatus Aminicenantes bacterium]